MTSRTVRSGGSWRACRRPHASPVTYEGALYFAAWSPGAAGDTEFLLPPFGLMLLADTNADKSLSKDEFQKTPLKEFFDLVDSNRDARITSDEWETNNHPDGPAKNTAFALEPGGTGDITSTHIRWQKEVKLPYVPSAIVYAGQYVMVKNGGIVTAYDAANGDKLYQKRTVHRVGTMRRPSRPTATSISFRCQTAQSRCSKPGQSPRDRRQIRHWVNASERHRRSQITPCTCEPRGTFTRLRREVATRAETRRRTGKTQGVVPCVSITSSRSPASWLRLGGLFRKIATLTASPVGES